MRYLFIVLFSLASLSSFANPKLADHSYNVYSQFGEDGIIEKIFKKIGTTSKIAIEFGASDGFSCSNTANLWTHDPAWMGILIEPHPQLFAQLIRHVTPYHCIAINAAVGIGADDSLEALLRAHNIRSPIDLLSIDVDGNDYYILESLSQIRPRLIICEYNPSIPAHLDIYPDYQNNMGCSVAALQRIAADKGYTLIAITDTNCFFILNEYTHLFADYDIDRDHISIDRYISYIIYDYKANYRVAGASNFRTPWGWSGHPAPDACHGNMHPIIARLEQTGSND